MGSSTSPLVFENKIPDLEHNTLSTAAFENKILQSEPNAFSKAVFENKIPDVEQNALSTTSQPFVHSKTFHISAIGVPLPKLPVTPKELVTTIYGSNRSIAYISTRGKRSSGNCILSSPDRGDLISTTYRRGPGRPPVLRYVETAKHNSGAEIEFEGKMLSFSQDFPTPAGEILEWSYVKETFGAAKEKTKVLALADVADGRKIARLVRTDTTRTEGSEKCSAGNGGLLIIEEDASGKVVDEALIIATCLVMLKKETDRKRCMQGMMISAA